MTGDAPAAAGGEVLVDARGRRCPLPVIDLARAASEHPPGTVLLLLATDPAAATDVPAWCTLRGHDYLGPADPPAGDEGAAAYRVRLTS